MLKSARLPQPLHCLFWTSLCMDGRTSTLHAQGNTLLKQLPFWLQG